MTKDQFKPKHVIFDKYVVRKFIVDGTVSTIYKVYDINKDKYILKHYSVKESNTSHMRERIEAEINNLKDLYHPNLISLIDHYESKMDGNFLILQDGGSTDLHGFQENYLPLHQISDISFQIMDAVEYLHTNGVLHRDIKSENVFVKKIDNNKLQCYLGDFDWSAKLNWTGKVPPPMSENGRQMIAGTYHCAAPEVLRCQSSSTESDIWSLGILIFEMYTNRCYPTCCSPFYTNIHECKAVGINCISGAANIIHHFLEHHVFEPLLIIYPESIPETSLKIQSLIRGMLQPDPKKRTSLSECKKKILNI
jgi:serine/threonine protein kinase